MCNGNGEWGLCCGHWAVGCGLWACVGGWVGGWVVRATGSVTVTLMLGLWRQRRILSIGASKPWLASMTSLRLFTTSSSSSHSSHPLFSSLRSSYFLDILFLFLFSLLPFFQSFFPSFLISSFQSFIDVNSSEMTAPIIWFIRSISHFISLIHV